MLHEQLSEYVENTGVKQVYISKKTGIPESRLSKLLKGDTRMLAEDFLEICEALNIDPKMFKSQNAQR